MKVTGFRWQCYPSVETDVSFLWGDLHGKGQQVNGDSVLSAQFSWEPKTALKN